jgi:hypothetical protein
MDSSLREGSVSTPEGVNVITAVPVSRENIEKIRAMGKTAIPVLSEYAKSANSRTQRIAVEFLGQIGGVDSVPPLRDVLLHSRSSANRFIALSWLAQSPPDVARRVLEQVQNDPDALIRNKAREFLRSSAEAGRPAKQPQLRRVQNPDFFITTAASGGQVLVPSQVEVSIEIAAPNYKSWPSLAGTHAEGQIRLRSGGLFKLTVALQCDTGSGKVACDEASPDLESSVREDPNVWCDEN